MYISRQLPRIRAITDNTVVLEELNATITELTSLTGVITEINSLIGEIEE